MKDWFEVMWHVLNIEGAMFRSPWSMDMPILKIEKWRLVSGKTGSGFPPGAHILKSKKWARQQDKKQEVLCFRDRTRVPCLYPNPY